MTDFDIYAIERLYAPTDDVLSEDSTEIRRIKSVIAERLNDTDRRIILAYAELGSVRQTARLFNVSPTTIWFKINEIRQKIKEWL